MSTPSVWILLTAIVILLAGVCVWGVFGHMDTVLPVVAMAEKGTVTAYVKQTDADKIVPEAAVTAGGAEGRVLSIGAEPVVVDASFSDYMRHVGALQEGEWVYPLALEIDCADGVHAAQIVIDSVSPMSFVLN